jgi:sec-independent protein translocase protein TatA
MTHGFPYEIAGTRARRYHRTTRARVLSRFQEVLVLGSIGMSEMLVILVIALVVFGPRRLPELGRTLGKTLAEFKKATNDLQRTFEEEVRLDAERKAAPPVQAAAAPAATVSADPKFGEGLARSAGGES